MMTLDQSESGRVAADHVTRIVHAEVDAREADRRDGRHRDNPHEPAQRRSRKPGGEQRGGGGKETEGEERMAAGKAVARGSRVVEEGSRSRPAEGELEQEVEEAGAGHRHRQQDGAAPPPPPGKSPASTVPSEASTAGPPSVLTAMSGRVRPGDARACTAARTRRSKASVSPSSISSASQPKRKSASTATAQAHERGRPGERRGSAGGRRVGSNLGHGFSWGWLPGQTACWSGYPRPARHVERRALRRARAAARARGRCA